MGIVVNKEKAKVTPCKCYRLGKSNKPEDLLCFSEGIIGTLSNKQDSEYCRDFNIVPATSKQTRHLKKFRLMGDVMNICMEENLETFLDCVSFEVERLKTEKFRKGE